MSADMLIEGGIVLTMDPQRKIVEDGAVAIQGNQIIDVGTREELTSRYANPKKIINAEKKLVMPGLINTHIHLLGFAAFKGIRPGNYGWGNPYTQRFLKIMDSPYWNEETFYQSGMLNTAEMIKTGTTTIVDCGTFIGGEKTAVKVIEDSGLRAILGMETMDLFGPPGMNIGEKRRKAFGSTQNNISRVDDLIQKYHKSADGRINVWACTMLAMNASDELLKGLKAMADRYDVGLVMHANNMRAQAEVVEKAWGVPDVERLARIGVLDRNCLLAHATDLNGREVILLREENASLAHCIFTSMCLCYGGALFSNFPAWREMGINIGIGTDDQCCSNTMDMFRAMNATYLVQKEAKYDCNLWPPEAVLEMATVNGARAVLLENEIGSLEAGKKADIILIDLMRPEWVPWHKYNLIENLVLSATGDSVDAVIINGKVIMEDREIKTFDEREVMEKVQTSAGALLETLDFIGPEKPYPENMLPLW